MGRAERAKGDSALDVLYLSASGQGWGPVDVLASLAAESLNGKLIKVVDTGEASKFKKLASLLPRKRSTGRRLLVIAAAPGLLAHAARIQHWWPGYESVAAWVIDSFWTDRVSRFAQMGRHFDHFFVTDKSLVNEWRAITKSPVSWLPWGADTLAVTQDMQAARPTDLLRMGRQPQAWDDDDSNREAAAALGITMQGRPPMGATGEANQRIVRNALAQSKYVLAFHNLVSPAEYTHPTRSYVTGRWTDALAAGATLVGAAPENAPDILWDGATVEISPIDRADALLRVRELVDAWTPEQALSQNRKARRALDWRWRLQELVEVLGWERTPALDRELGLLSST